MTDQNAIVVSQRQIITSFDDAERAAKAMAGSGFFQDSKSAAQAVVKILAGQELGFGPFASMTGVNIIQNKPVLAANLMAAAVKRTGKYNYRILKLDETGCELEFYEAGKPVGKSSFAVEDAKKAGLTGKDNWIKYPRNMFFARALSNGQKWYAPDVFNGATVYTPDELGAVEDAEGNIIDVQPEEPVKVAPVDQPAVEIPEDFQPKVSLEEAMAEKNSKGIPYGELESPILTVMYNKMSSLKDKTDEHLYKMDCIRTIMADRELEK